MTASDLLAAFRDGRDDPRDVLDRSLDRLHSCEIELNAFAAVLADSAREAAKISSARWREGRARPLEGIPVAIKDMIDVEGAPTGWGTKAAPPVVAERDAIAVARLRAAGAVIVGKTNCLEYAYGVAHPEVGQTNNPFDPARTAGGSSGGSAAAVAAGIVPIALGTDTGGSIRIPAAYCGIAGMKPTYGLVPTEGVFPLSWSLDHVGPLAATIMDLHLTLTVLSGKEVNDAPSSGSLRLGLVRNHFPADPANAAVAELARSALGDVRGAVLEEIHIPSLADANGALMDILLPEASVIHRDLLRQNPEGYAGGTRAQIEAGFHIPATAYAMARRRGAEIADDLDRALRGVDALVSPAVPFVAPTSDPEIGGEGDSEMLASGFSNLTGHPSVVIPVGFVDGLPVGLQITGRRGADADLLALAARLEAGVDDARGPELGSPR